MLLLMEVPVCLFIGAVASRPRDSYDWHTHDSEELCVVLEDSTTIGHAGRKRRARPGQVFWFRQGERHGYWNQGQDSPRLLVYNFALRKPSVPWLDRIYRAAPAQRVWHLSQEKVQSYARLFYQGQLWRSRREEIGTTLLDLLLFQLLSLLEQGTQSVEAAVFSDEDMRVMRWVEERLWAGDWNAASSGLPNYDSLRHRFAARHGLTPIQLLRRMRLQKAQLLLLQTSLSIKEISSQLGYQRQHEFSRAFRQQFGCSPAQWRKSPQ